MQNWYAAPAAYIKAMFVARGENGRPIGCFAILKDDKCSYYNCGTYVIEPERRKGIGKSLIALAKSLDYSIIPWKGSGSAHSFYTNVLS